MARLVERADPCGRCRGLGFVDVDCPDCSGAGETTAIETEAEAVERWRRRRATARAREDAAEHAAAHGGPDRWPF